MMLIRNGRIHDAVHARPYIADILVDNGKIVKIGKNIDAKCEIIDAKGYDLWPGFIDAHTHIGMFGYGGKGAWTKDDVELYKRCTPENRGIDCLNPKEDSFEHALRAGVTAVCTGPGSVNCMGGTHAVVKTYGHRIDDMIVKDPAAMKIAFGENPKSTLKASLTTRMTIAAEIRTELQRAKEYMAAKDEAAANGTKPPAFQPGYEALIPVLRREIPLKAHAHRADDIFTAIRIAKEFNCLLTLEHASDAGEMIEDLKREQISVAAGPFISQPQKPENQNADPKNAVRMIEAGINVCMMTDSPIIAEQYLPLCGGLLMREGLDEFRALQAITVNAAKHLGVEDRIGHIGIGMDADIVFAHGCPMDMRVKAEKVIISGRMVGI